MQTLCVEPSRTLCRLAHLASVGRYQQGHGQAEESQTALPASEVFSFDNVGSLVGATDLHCAAAAAVQFGEVVRLQ